MPEETQLTLPPTKEFEEARHKAISSLTGRLHRHPWMLWDGQRRSTRSVLLELCHNTEHGRKFVREVMGVEV